MSSSFPYKSTKFLTLSFTIRSNKESVNPLTDFLTAKNLAAAGIAGVFTSTTPLAPPSGISLFLSCCAKDKPYASSNCLLDSCTYLSELGGVTNRRPPLAISLKRQWKALKCLPWTKNTPNGIGLRGSSGLGIIIDGSIRRDKAYLSSLKKLVLKAAAVPSSILSSTVRGESKLNMHIWLRMSASLFLNSWVDIADPLGLNLSINSSAIEAAWCMQTELTAMQSTMLLILMNAWLSILARGPWSIEQKALMISAFSVPNHGNLINPRSVVESSNHLALFRSFFSKSATSFPLPRGSGLTSNLNIVTTAGISADECSWSETDSILALLILYPPAEIILDDSLNNTSGRTLEAATVIHP
mmetsp:Transcript_21572/g.20859  ORF Transcript_21572/g.20859 Transcript_21572/m.20859 type:complete len:357 (-) Transcript_21572:1004-2074(-)